MSPAEDAYGLAKRLAFCEEIIAARRPAFVLDVGCGTGENLTRPLAERFPEVRFLGIDDDPESIRYARAGAALPNLSFGGYEELAQAGSADLIIASEVIEHVESPEEFLVATGGHLGPGGRMIVTAPNGFGPFELASLTEVLLRLSGAFALLRKAKRALVGGSTAAHARDTLAASPHVSFFSYGRIREVFGAAGFEVERYQARTLLCGFGFDSLVKGLALGRWNARVADRFSPRCVSAWMFVLKKAAPRPAALYRRGFIARWRRRLNERCWGKSATRDAAR
jgi:SAM-dependent methyltransferase